MFQNVSSDRYRCGSAAFECYFMHVMGSSMRRMRLSLVGVLVALWSAAAAAGVATAALAAGGIEEVAAPSETTGEPRPVIVPLPRDHGRDAAKVALGRRLFFEPRLSRDNTVSCASCHDLDRGGTDRRRHSVGLDGAVGSINAPTVFNSGFNFAQFWDGRAPSLEEQIEGPLHHPKEMASNWSQVLGKLRRDEDYLAAFREVYGAAPSRELVKDAIATFERALITPDSPFDRFLRGEPDAISATARAGFEKFKHYGCVACHQGRNVGGNMFAKFGIMADYFADRGDVRPADLGRYNVTGRERDRHVFKVPSLRSVALTPPYFHDGTAATLEEAVQVMGRYQLGVSLSDEDVEEIVVFLGTLTGKLSDVPQR